MLITKITWWTVTNKNIVIAIYLLQRVWVILQHQVILLVLNQRVLKKCSRFNWFVKFVKLKSDSWLAS